MFYLGSLSRSSISISRTTTRECLYFPENPSIFPSYMRCLSSRILNGDTGRDQFTVSYLVNSCGLSLESAKSAAEDVQFETRDQPDSVLSVLKSFNPSEKEISNLVEKRPKLLLLSCPETTLLPKIEYFRSKGLSEPKIAKLFLQLLCCGLEKSVVPAYESLRSVLGSDEMALKVLLRNGSILCRRIVSLQCKVSVLRENGIPDSVIYKMLYYFPRSFFMSLGNVGNALDVAREMGFVPSRSNYYEVIGTLMSMKSSTWQTKAAMLRKWNLSDEQVLVVFRYMPAVMRKSEKKIEAVMEFLVDKMRWEPSIVVKYSTLFAYSLEKRLIPRASVLQFLVSKGLLKEKSVTPAVFIYSEAKFAEKFVNCRPESPELLKLYIPKSVVSRKQRK